MSWIEWNKMVYRQDYWCHIYNSEVKWSEVKQLVNQVRRICRYNIHSVCTDYIYEHGQLYAYLYTLYTHMHRQQTFCSLSTSHIAEYLHCTLYCSIMYRNRQIYSSQSINQPIKIIEVPFFKYFPLRCKLSNRS